MEKTIGLLFFGFIFGLSVCFGGGSPEMMAARAVVEKEAERLAEGVDFGNPVEVRVFETALRNNSAFKGYLNGIRSIWGDSITEDYLIEQAVEGQRSRQERERIEKQAQRNLAGLDEWAASNIPEKVKLFDLSMQQQIMNDFGQNVVIARENTEQYIGQWFQFVGQITSVRREDNRWRYEGGEEYFRLELKRTDGVHISVRLNMDQSANVQQIKEGDMVVAGGRLSRFFERTSSPWGLLSVDFEEGVLRVVALD